MTDRRPRGVSGWDAPPHLVFRVPDRARDDVVLGQAVDVNDPWWSATLTKVGLGDEIPPAPDGRISRAQLFAIGEEATNGPTEARRLLWASLSWGTGRRQRLNRRRIASVVEHLEWSGALLVEAASASQTSARAGLAVLQQGTRPKLRYLGPSFSTKFLYFAGGGAPDHPSLILDEVVATRLRRTVSPAFPSRRWWDPDVYADYCRVLAAGAERASTRSRPVAADELEAALFRGEGI